MSETSKEGRKKRVRRSYKTKLGVKGDTNKKTQIWQRDCLKKVRLKCKYFNTVTLQCFCIFLFLKVKSERQKELVFPLNEILDIGTL